MGEHGLLPFPPLHTSWHPRPPCVCLFVCFCAVCALHGVSPRDRWLCVLPGWQMNVNVNGGQTDDLISAGRSVINQALAWESCPWEK